MRCWTTLKLKNFTRVNYQLIMDLLEQYQNEINRKGNATQRCGKSS
ncbi:MAG: hypothetical protein ACI85I_001065 [Arenicella sp.]|jgi:hypothetical protein